MENEEKIFFCFCDAPDYLYLQYWRASSVVYYKDTSTPARDRKYISGLGGLWNRLDPADI